MKIIVPKFVEYSLMNTGNSTRQKNALKIYAALWTKAKRRSNKDGYFPIPSTYLESINKRYSIIMKKLIEDGIIESYKFIKDDPELFDLDRKKITKGYNKQMGICMKYRFLIDINKGKEIDVDMDSQRTKGWWKKTYSSLQALGYKDIKISRDGFGRRVHHTLTQDYKTELTGQGLSVIDAKCSQPRLLYLIMKERGVIDDNYFHIFDNKEDFYSVLIEKLNEEDRQSSKDLFMYWLNSGGYVPNYDIHKLFPQASQFIKTLKNNHYKDASSYMQREEAKIWIDDLLENLPVPFGLTIHDSLIIKDRDVMKVLKYCKDKYPQIEFDIKEL
jgi:hypothetical protein